MQNLRDLDSESTGYPISSSELSDHVNAQEPVPDDDDVFHDALEDVHAHNDDHGDDGVDDDDEEEDNLGDVDDEATFPAILDTLRKQWMFTEIHHRVSKAASNKFWEIASKYFAALHEVNYERKRIAQFQQQRKVLQRLHVPQISLDVAYENKDTKEVVEIHDVTSIPVSRFPPTTYNKLYEIGSIQVNNILSLIKSAFLLY